LDDKNKGDSMMLLLAKPTKSGTRPSRSNPRGYKRREPMGTWVLIMKPRNENGVGSSMKIN